MNWLMIVLGIYLTGWLYFAVLMVVASKGRSWRNVPLFFVLPVGWVLALLWPLLLVGGIAWGMVSGIRQNQEDKRVGDAVRKEIFANYPEFNDAGKG